jgi:hypothetical protein
MTLLKESYETYMKLSSQCKKEIFIKILASSFRKWHLVLIYKNVSNLGNQKALKQTSF